MELLKTEYPGALDLRSLQFAVDNLGWPMPEGLLAAHLSYLQEKGYVMVERREGFGFRIAFASLSAQGWDLIDGFCEDAGIGRAL